jgi:nitrate reductase NapE component
MEGAVEALDPEERRLELSLLLLRLVEKVNPLLTVGLVRGYDEVWFV